MARVVIAPTAVDDLATLIQSYSLPPDTVKRVKHSLRPLAEFPLLGAALHGRWQGFRFILGPWRWLIVVYLLDEARDEAQIVTFQDGRSASWVG